MKPLSSIGSPTDCFTKLNKGTGLTRQAGQAVKTESYGDVSLEYYPGFDFLQLNQEGVEIMKIHYDQNVDAAYLQLSEEIPEGVVEISEGVNLDLTEEGKIVGIEILNASKKFPLQSLFTCEYEPKLMAGTA